jgi:autophagy-related protein 2
MDVDSFKYFPTLVDDVSKLSTVAKYLPEDDRPGILILGLIRDLDFHVSANKAVGDVQFTTQNLEVAHVGLPSLLALCIERLRLHRNHDEELVGEAIASNPPTPHARTLWLWLDDWR